MDLASTAGLWLAVVLSGLYHGLNPGMGWPLAVSASLFERRLSALWLSLGALSFGHFVAMLGVLLPFSLMNVLIEHQREIRIGASLIAIVMGLYLIITRRHPRFLARSPPQKLALWSFFVALAHGAALMLVPIYLGLCSFENLDNGHRAAGILMKTTMLAFGVAVCHTIAMMSAGGIMAYSVYRWLGLKFLNRGWLDSELLWAFSLIIVGFIGFLTSI
jgi:hypothetical protein